MMPLSLFASIVSKIHQYLAACHSIIGMWNLLEMGRCIQKINRDLDGTIVFENYQKESNIFLLFCAKIIEIFGKLEIEFSCQKIVYAL